MCLLHCQYTPKRNYIQSFSCPHTGQMPGGGTVLLAAVCDSISYLYMRSDDEVYLEKKVVLRSLPKMDVQCSPTITSYLSNPLCDESSWLLHKAVWWNAFACGWEWHGVRSAGRWEMGAFGAEGRRMWIFYLFIFFPLCLSFLPFLIFKAYIPGSRTIAGSWKCFFFVGVIKSEAGKYSDWWRMSIKESEHTLIRLSFTQRSLKTCWCEHFQRLRSVWFRAQNSEYS